MDGASLKIPEAMIALQNNQALVPDACMIWSII
jgi:hypothetical protein